MALIASKSCHTALLSDFSKAHQMKEALISLYAVIIVCC